MSNKRSNLNGGSNTRKNRLLNKIIVGSGGAM